MGRSTYFLVVAARSGRSAKLSGGILAHVLRRTVIAPGGPGHVVVRFSDALERRQTSPRRTARTAASARETASSFCKMALTCLETVRSLM